jgi:DNA-directed RNA polymerase subunit RPC12/RpoP
MNILGLVCVSLIVLLGVFGLAVALLVRCSVCGRRVLVKMMPEPPFPTPIRQASEISAGRFQCMYCGQHHVL